eukprot:1158326-Pelagomonas_calceolata.AAC.14
MFGWRNAEKRLKGVDESGANGAPRFPAHRGGVGASVPGPAVCKQAEVASKRGRCFRGEGEGEGQTAMTRSTATAAGFGADNWGLANRAAVQASDSTG